MTKRYRLKTRAQMHGEVRDAGYIFTLAEGEVGPHRTVVSSQHGAQIVDHINESQQLTDEPLFEELTEDHNAALDEAEAKQAEEADAHAEATAERAPDPVEETQADPHDD